MTRFINPKNPLRQAAGAQSKGTPAPVIAKVASKKDEDHYENGVFNPKRFAGFNSAGQPVTSKTERMYDSKGEMNASDNKDAISQFNYLHDHAVKGINKSAETAVIEENRENVRRAIQAALSDGGSLEGLNLVAQQMNGPVKAIADYNSWSDKLFRKRNLGQAEQWRLALDIRATAFTIGQDGQAFPYRATGRYITPPEVKVVAFSEVDIQEVLHFNWDVIDRIQETAPQEINREKDKYAVRVLEAASTAVNTATSFSTTSIALFENLRLMIDRHSLLARQFLIHRNEAADIQINMSASLDMVSQRELNLSGYIGRLLGCDVLTCTGTQPATEVVPAGTIYAVTDPDYLGEMGVRQSLMSQPYDGLNRHEWIKGFGWLTILGFVCPQPKAVAKAVKS